MMICALNECNIFYIVSSFIFNESYRENFTLSYSRVKWDISLFEVIKRTLTEYRWKFDYLIVFGTNLFQIFLPCLAAAAGLIFYGHFRSIDKMKWFRVKSYKQSLLKEISDYSLKMAGALFLAYMLFFLFLLIVARGNMYGDMGRTLLLDILGNSFYARHTYLYYVLDGLVRFFLMPYIYAFLSCTIAVQARSQKQVFLLSNLYYYGLSIVGFSLYYSLGEYALYLNPSVIMASGSYNDVNTLLLVLLNIVPLVFSLLYLLLRQKGDL